MKLKFIEAMHTHGSTSWSWRLVGSYTRGLNLKLLFIGGLGLATRFLILSEISDW
jgi:hypothetical protein